jgi:hypothetical protein
MPGIWDYARELIREFNNIINFDQAVAAIVRGSRAVIDVERKQVVSTTKVGDTYTYRTARALSGMLRGLVPLSNIGKARFAGIPPVALVGTKSIEVILDSIGDVFDPLRAVSILC